MSESSELLSGHVFREFVLSFRDESGRQKYLERLRRMLNSGSRSLVVEYNDLYSYNVDLAERVVERPRETLRELDEVLEDIVKEVLGRGELRQTKRYRVRIAGLYESTKIREVRSEHVGKLVQIEGIVTRMHPHKSKIVRARFLHDKCGMDFLWPPTEEEEIGDKIERPTVCPRCGEAGGKFLLLADKSELRDWQKIAIQEKPEDVPGGQMPRSIAANLTDDLVDSVRPGDRVTLVGIVSLQASGPSLPYYDLYIEANSVRVSERALEEIVITREDEEKILEMKRDPWIKEKIIASIAPAIYGHWDLKEAIALLLFGGRPKISRDGTRIRGDIHVLFIGDPGVAKSQLLQAGARIAPRAVFTAGKGSTAAGLTAAVVRDARTGEFYLEAGALVLADGGVAVIDEIDKMDPKDRAAIHEAMEQQYISISKAGIVARLNSRASVLAAGNPRFGLYDPEKNFADNVNLPPTILSRFDLIFVIRDTISKERDKQLVRHILDVHSETDRVAPEIEPEMLKKYIIYAKRYVRPELTEEAKRLIEKFFVEMRSSALQYQRDEGQAPVPITARQLESIIRLTEAHARMALRDRATEEDAAMAVRLMSVYLSSVGLDVESGVPDVSTVMTGMGLTARRTSATILELLKQKGAEGKCVNLSEIIEEMKKKGVDEQKTRELISKLKAGGQIVERRHECFSYVS